MSELNCRATGVCMTWKCLLWCWCEHGCSFPSYLCRQTLSDVTYQWWRHFTNMLMTLPQCTCPCHFTQLCILTQKQESKTIFYKKSFNNHLQVTYNYNKELKNIVLMWSNKCFSSDSEVHLVEKRWTCNRKFQMESSGAGFPNDLLRINKAGPFMCFFMWYLWPLSGNRGRRQVSLCLFPKLVFFTTAAVWGWEDQSESLGDICAWSGSVSYDELITAPVLIATVRQVPPDDDWNFPTPVEMRQKNKQCIRTAHGHRTHSNRWEQHLVTETRPPTWAHLHLHVKKSTLCKTFFFVTSKGFAIRQRLLIGQIWIGVHQLVATGTHLVFFTWAPAHFLHFTFAWILEQ